MSRLNARKVEEIRYAERLLLDFVDRKVADEEVNRLIGESRVLAEVPPVYVDEKGEEHTKKLIKETEDFFEDPLRTKVFQRMRRDTTREGRTIMGVWEFLMESVRNMMPPDGNEENVRTFSWTKNLKFADLPPLYQAIIKEAYNITRSAPRNCSSCRYRNGGGYGGWPGTPCHPGYFGGTRSVGGTSSGASSASSRASSGYRSKQASSDLFYFVIVIVALLLLPNGVNYGFFKWVGGILLGIAAIVVMRDFMRYAPGFFGEKIYRVYRIDDK